MLRTGGAAAARCLVPVDVGEAGPPARVAAAQRTLHLDVYDDDDVDAHSASALANAAADARTAKKGAKKAIKATTT